MKKIYKLIQPCFISLNSFSFFNKFGRLYYHLGLKVFLSSLKHLPEIKSIYVRHSFVSEDWIPWVSDIDLTLVIEDMDVNKEIRFLNKFWRIYRVLNIPFPFINHIDIFSLEELKSDALYNEPLLKILINDCNLLYGNEYRKIRDCAQQNTYWVRAYHWLSFMQWFYEDNLNKKTYVRKYYNFFNKLLCLSQERNINADNLSELLSYAQASHFWLTAPAEFIYKVFFHSITILGSAYKQQTNTQTAPARFKFVDADKDLSAAFLDDIGIFIDSLSRMKNHIRSIFVDSGSIQYDNYRIWIILDNHIGEEDFIEFAGLVRKNARCFLKLKIYPYIFLEDALNFFLTNRWFWPFEYYHLKRHARIVFGDELLNETNRPSDASLIDISRKSGLVYKYRSRNILNNLSHEEHLRFLLNVLARKIFLEEMAVVTTPGELVKACTDLYSGNEMNWVTALINKKHMNKAEFYSLIKSILADDPVDEYSTNREDKISSSSVQC